MSKKKGLESQTLKNLKIKSSTVKRIHKEFLLYQKERDEQKQKVEKMKNEGADAYDIKKQQEILTESEKMVPDSQQRLQTALDALIELMKSIESSDEKEIVGSAAWIDSEKIRDEAKLDLGV